MKKFASIALCAAMLVTLLAACGAKETAPETTVAPETTAPTETTIAPETTEAPEMEETLEGEIPAPEMPELNETGKLLEEILANHKDVEMPMMTNNLDLTNADLLTYNAGLTSGDKLLEGAVSEPMMGQPFSLVLLKVKDAADAAAVAQEVYDNTDQRKWICMEADTKIAGYYEDMVMFFMVSSDFADTATTETMMEAFKTVAGGDVTVIG